MEVRQSPGLEVPAGSLHWGQHTRTSPAHRRSDNTMRGESNMVYSSFQLNLQFLSAKLMPILSVWQALPSRAWSKYTCTMMWNNKIRMFIILKLLFSLIIIVFWNYFNNSSKKLRKAIKKSETMTLNNKVILKKQQHSKY